MTTEDLSPDSGAMYYPQKRDHDQALHVNTKDLRVFSDSPTTKSGIWNIPFDARPVAKLEADPSGKPLNSLGAKADAGKPLPWLFFSGFANAMEEVAKVTTEGAKKYTPNGWATVEKGAERYMEAFARHMVKLGQGEIMDTGPGGIGTYHKAQMIWNLLASLELELRETKK